MITSSPWLRIESHIASTYRHAPSIPTSIQTLWVYNDQYIINTHKLMGKESKDSADLNNSLILASFKKIKPTPRSLASLTLYRNKNPHKQHQRTLTLTEGKAEHQAKNFGNQASEKMVKYVIGIRDTKTNHIDFVETSDIFDIALKIPEPTGKFEISQPFYDPQHKRRLVQEFGTNKSKRKINQMMSNIIKE